MNLPDTGSSRPVMNGHNQKPRINGHPNSTTALDIAMDDSSIPATSRTALDNPFYAISTELQYLSSGVSLSLQPESSGRGDEGPNGSRLESRREGRGREWMEAIRRIKGFVEGSDDRIYQISPTDPSVSARLSSSRNPAKQTKRTRPDENESFKPEMNGRAVKTGRMTSHPSSQTRVQNVAGGNHEVEVYPEVPKQILDMIYLPPETKEAGPSSSSAPGHDSTGKNGAMQVDLDSDEMSVRRLGGGRVPIWGTRETLVQGLERITSGGVLPSTSAPAKALVLAGTIPGPESRAMGALEAGLEPGLDHAHNHNHNPRLELELEDYWPARPLKRTSPTNHNPTRPGEPEFTLRFRLEGCLRGWVVFGPRVPRNRLARPGEEDADLDGFGGGGAGGIRGGRYAGREERKERMMAVRFNVFGDTELSKGKNDLSAYKTMVDLARYLAGLELDFGETLDRLRAYGDLMSQPCFRCGRLQASSSGSGTVGIAGLGAGAGSGGLPIGRARASSDDQAGWMAFHLDCLSV